MQNLVFLIKISILMSFSTSFLILSWILLLSDFAVVRSCCFWLSSLSEMIQCWVRNTVSSSDNFIINSTHHTVCINCHCCWLYSENSSAKTDLYRFLISHYSQRLITALNICIFHSCICLSWSDSASFKHYFILCRFMIKINEWKMKKKI